MVLSLIAIVKGWGMAGNKFIHLYHLPYLLKICLTRHLACY